MQIAYDTYIYYFKLPDKGTFNLQVGQHIVIKGIFKKSVITRPYTPINVSLAKRSFELIIKIYPKGKMSSLVSEWKVGNEIEMRGPYGCFTYVPNAYKRIVMLAGGTGIAPMYEVIQYILNNEEDYTKIHLLYSSKNFKDILLREELLLLKSYWNFTMCHHLSQQESVCDKKYSEEVKLGRVTKQDVEEEIRKGCDGNSLVLISGTKSFDKDMMNAALNVSHGSESNIFKF
ncbi:UNVERIFIED_CONTAM: hypothetical protein GTU68_027946 [Idotea baltica]|nr:hypothetical protein [Idotea baltica]